MRPTCGTKHTQEFVTHKYIWWLVQLYFLVSIGFIVLYFSIICFVNSSVIQPFCILLQRVLINSHYYYYYYYYLQQLKGM